MTESSVSGHRQHHSLSPLPSFLSISKFSRLFQWHSFPCHKQQRSKQKALRPDKRSVPTFVEYRKNSKTHTVTDDNFFKQSQASEGPCLCGWLSERGQIRYTRWEITRLRFLQLILLPHLPPRQWSPEGNTPERSSLAPESIRSQCFPGADQ